MFKVVRIMMERQGERMVKYAPFADNNMLLPPAEPQNFIWLIFASISKLFKKSNSGSWLWY